MKSFISKALMLLTVCMTLMLACCDAAANTWGQPYQFYPHFAQTGTTVNLHDRISPANTTTAAVVANGHGWFTLNVAADTTAQCVSGTTWTYYTFDVVFRPGAVVSYGYVHFMKQDCPS